MIDPSGDKDDDVDTADTKKRPLSISSSSSASSSSLTRHQRKRPNLTICDEHHKTNGSAVICEGHPHSDMNGNSKVSEMEYETSPSGCDILPMETNSTASSSGSVDGCPTGSGGTTVLPGGKVVAKCSKRSYNGSVSPPTSPNRDMDSSKIQNRAATLPSVSKSASRQGNQKKLEGISASASSPSSPKSSPSSPKSPGPARDASSTSSTGGGSKTHYVSYVQRVVSEIIESERTYVKSLEDIIQVKVTNV